MFPHEFALMVIAVMVATALPAWAWWAAADDDGPEVLPDARLRAAIEASAGPSHLPAASTDWPYPSFG